MALTFQYSLIYTDTEGLFRISNDTVYGGANPLRNQGGEVLIVAHIDETDTENFITVDSTPYLTKTLYDVSNNIDGYYHVETLRFPLYSPGVTYTPEVRDSNNIITSYAGIQYYSNTNKFYQNISTSTAIAPDAIGGTTFWKEITDFTTTDIRKNTNLVVGIFDCLFDFRGRVGVKDELYKIVSKGCGCNENLNKLLPYLKEKLLLVGARAKMEDNNPAQAETITRQLQLFIDAK